MEACRRFPYGTKDVHLDWASFQQTGMPPVEDLAFLGWLDVYPVPCSGNHTKEQERNNILPRLMTISNRYLVIQHSLHRKVATRVMVFGVCNRENPAKEFMFGVAC